MFGYVLPDKPEMKMKEYELFRAYYCGVCKSMGKNFGMLSRLALNYDSVFLGLLLSSIAKESLNLRKEACLANPFKKKWIVKDSKFVDYVADINILFTYYKLRDNWNDEKRFSSLVASKGFSWGFRKVKAEKPDLHNYVNRSIVELSELEHNNCSSMDKAAEPFAKALGNILEGACVSKETKTLKAINWLGYNLGKWIYLIDAYDDIEKDIQNKCYNPLVLQYNYKYNENIEKFKCNLKEEVNLNLIYSMGQVAQTVNLLDMNNKPIVENIVYLGMYKKTEQIMEMCKQ